MRESGPPLRLSRRSGSLRVLQRVRDEAHRFGLAYHRHLRTRRRVASALDRIPGIGPARRAALLKEFGSVAAVAEASVEDVVRRAHLSPALAERVLTAVRRGAPAPDPLALPESERHAS
jgi:excinuclease ABC subunit C